MLVAIIGENCVGKSTLANKINQELNAKIYCGNDYLRLGKSPTLALEKFKNMLFDAVNGENLIYLVTDKSHLELIPVGAYKIVLTADLSTIEQRFKERMRGTLPPPVQSMLERKHGIYDNLDCDLKLNQDYDIAKVLTQIKANSK